MRVAVGLLTDARGRVLVNQRRPGTHMAGAWEFPGGKRRAGETSRDALERELDEELGIEIGCAEPALTLEHAYADRQVVLEVYRVLSYEGVPRGREGQRLRWVTCAELDTLDLLEADRPIVELLRKTTQSADLA